MSEQEKEILAEEKVFQARMVKDFGLYSAQDVFEQHLDGEEFVTPDCSYALKYVAPYDRKGRRDKDSDGFEKPRVKVRAFFRKCLSLKDYHELYGVNESLKHIEHKVHSYESLWHNDWKERVRSFCEIEKRFYPRNIPVKSGYKIADAYYGKTNTVIEFQKSFDDEALSKYKFYVEERIKLIWLFYVPTLEVFESDGMYKIREDNFYHFFRIDSILPDFYSNNIVFLQDKNKKIYHIKSLERAEPRAQLEGTVRHFEKGLVFKDSEVFANWFRYDWKKSDLYVEKEKSIEEILELFNDKKDKMFYLQNCEKKDINGNYLIYAFIKDDGEIRKDNLGYLGYRCYIRSDNRYTVNSSWDYTRHNPRTKKWLLLATDCHKYNDLRPVEDKRS